MSVKKLKAGRCVRHRFPAYGEFDGEVLGPIGLTRAGRYTIKWSDESETTHTAAQIDKMRPAESAVI